MYKYIVNNYLGKYLFLPLYCRVREREDNLLKIAFVVCTTKLNESIFKSERLQYTLISSVGYSRIVE